MWSVEGSSAPLPVPVRVYYYYGKVPVEDDPLPLRGGPTPLHDCNTQDQVEGAVLGTRVVVRRT